MPESSDENGAARAAEPLKPAEAEVRAELVRILSSRCFEQAGRSTDFLRFVVEQTLAGAGQRLKGYTIGVEVFGRPADFDAQADALVRVEAGRLRRRLIEYYAEEGAGSSVRMVLPRGSYAVDFRLAQARAIAATPTAAAVAASPIPAAASVRRRWSAPLGLLLVVAVGIIALQQRALLEARGALDAIGEPARTEWPRIIVVPFENLSTDRALDVLAVSMTEEIMLRLDELDLFVIAAQASWYDPGSVGRPLGVDAEGGYVLTGSVRGGTERARIIVRLIEARTGRQLWAAAYDEPLAIEQLPALHEQVAREVVSVAAPYGPIFEAELARARRSEHAPALRDCLVTYYDYRRRIDPASHRDALMCFQSVSARRADFAPVWAGLAMLYFDAYGFGFEQDPSESLAAGRAATLKALALNGDDFLSNLARTRLLFFDGDPSFRQSIKRTLALRPDSAEALGQAGMLLTISGDSAAGLALVERARAITKGSTGIYNFAYAVAYLREGRFEEALSAALKIDAPNWIVAQAVIAAAAGQSGRDDIAREATQRILELQPQFETDARSDLLRWQLDPAFSEMLVGGLRAAGLNLR